MPKEKKHYKFTDHIFIGLALCLYFGFYGCSTISLQDKARGSSGRIIASEAGVKRASCSYYALPQKMLFDRWPSGDYEFHLSYKDPGVFAKLWGGNGLKIDFTHPDKSEVNFDGTWEYDFFNVDPMLLESSQNQGLLLNLSLENKNSKNKRLKLFENLNPHELHWELVGEKNYFSDRFSERASVELLNSLQDFKLTLSIFKICEGEDPQQRRKLTENLLKKIKGSRQNQCSYKMAPKRVQLLKGNHLLNVSKSEKEIPITLNISLTGLNSLNTDDKNQEGIFSYYEVLNEGFPKEFYNQEQEYTDPISLKKSEGPFFIGVQAFRTGKDGSDEFVFEDFLLDPTEQSWLAFIPQDGAPYSGRSYVMLGNKAIRIHFFLFAHCPSKE